MNFTKEQINNWIAMFYMSENKERLQKYPIESKFIHLAFLVEGKALIDRWNNVSNNYIFHSSRKEEVEKITKNHIYYSEENNTIWGCTLNYLDHIHPNMVLVLALDRGTDKLSSNESGDDANSIGIITLKDQVALDAAEHSHFKKFMKNIKINKVD